jgi:integrase
MGRPPLPIGTYGRIATRKTSSHAWEAYARLRAPDGGLVPVKRRGKSKTEAENNLKAALKDAMKQVRNAQISPATRFVVIANQWHEEIQREATLGDRSPETVRLYRSYLDNWILPVLANLRAREVTVHTCDRAVKRTQDKGSYAVAKAVRAVLSGVCGYAVRHGAMDTNPIRSISRLVGGAPRTVVALTADQRADLLTKLHDLAARRAVDAKGRSLGTRARIWTDLPDLVRTMLATGVRMGELLALDGAAFDRDTRTLAIDWHLIRVTGCGLHRRPLRKGHQPGLLLRVPTWSLNMLTRRTAAAGDGRPLFPSTTGGWLDPSNVINRIREAFGECGYGWVTSHAFRKTVATVLDQAGLPSGAVADQLGNTRAVAERHYIARRVANEQAADALETIIDMPMRRNEAN